MKAGRPCKLTPDVQKKLVKALREGNFRNAAAFHAGISERVLQAWMKSGRDEPSGPFAALRRAVLEAEKGAEIFCVGVIRTAARKGDWKAAAWWLERKVPEHWARPKLEANEGTGQPAVQVVVQKYEAEGTP